MPESHFEFAHKGEIIRVPRPSGDRALYRLPMVWMPGRPTWRSWLAENHTRKEGIWLVTAKKGSGFPKLVYADAVEEALCFGWIDSVTGKVDERFSRQLYTPRKAGSTWSKVNKERISRLEPAGLIQPSGQRLIDMAREDGSWNVLDAIEALEVPEDLQKALQVLPAAWENWERFSPSSRKGILAWIAQAKRPETRTRRIEKTARMANEGKRAQFDG